MNNATEPVEYVLARQVLLDALSALGPHREAVVLVGAQAVYLHTGDADVAVAPTTTDADIALAPALLRDEPLLEAALRAAGFTPGANPGTWHGALGIAVDLMVPEALSGSGGRRGARLPIHGNHVARRTTGLEPALVDNDCHVLTSLDPADPRTFEIRVAGPAALLVAKTIKMDERLDQPDRLKAKDALDVLRLLQTSDTAALSQRLVELSHDPLSAEVTRAAVRSLRLHGSTAKGAFAALAAQAHGVLADPYTTAASFAVLTEDLLIAFDRSTA